MTKTDIKEIENLLTKIENQGWEISELNCNKYELSYDVSYIEIFEFVIQGNTANELMDSILKAYENYDLEEEVTLKLDDYGYSKSEAPYEVIVDTYNALKNDYKLIYELYNSLIENK